jgi:hypothetical protein
MGCAEGYLKKPKKGCEFEKKENRKVNAMRKGGI